MKKKILIIGGTGFIGNNLIKKLNKKKFLVSSLSTKKKLRIKKEKNVKYLFCDIANNNKLKKILKDISFDYVVNLGGYVDHSNKKKTFESHFLGVKNLAEIFIKKKIKKFIQIGTSIENGKITSPQKENYNTKIKSIKSTYGRAKLLSSLYFLDLYNKMKFPVTIFRLFQVYGPGQDPNRVISFTIDQCIKNNYFNCSDGNQYRDFIYIDDVIDFIILSLNNKISNGQIYNLGSGKPQNIKETIIKITKIIKKGNPIFGKIKFRKDEMKNIYSNNNKLLRDFKKKKLIKFDLGLIKTINSKINE